MALLHELFIAAANKFPDKYAVIWDTSSSIFVVTFAQLFNESGIVTDMLISAGVGNEYVGLLVECLMIYPAVAMGILRSSCAYVPLDLQTPLEWNLQLIRRLNIRFLLADSDHGLTEEWKVEKELSVHCETVYLMSNTKGLRKVFEGGNLTMAYAIQTSGTTGIPKIIRVPHQSIVPNITQLRNIFAVGPDDTVFLSSPLTFDPSVVETFIALSSGAALLIAPHYLRAAPGPLLFRFLFEKPRECCQNVSILSVTPSYAACLLGSPSNILPKNIHPCLKILSLGGEPCPPLNVLLEWKNKLGGQTKIFSLYGITEVSCWASIAEIELNDKNPNRAVSTESVSAFSDASSSLLVETVPSDSNKFVANISNEITGNSSLVDNKTSLTKSLTYSYSRCMDGPGIQRNDEKCSVNRNFKSVDVASYLSLGPPMLQTLMEVRDSVGNIVTDGEGELFIGSDTRVCLLDDEDVSLAGKGNIIFRATGDIVKVHKTNNSSVGTSSYMFSYVQRRDDVVKRFGRWVLTKHVETVATEFVWEYQSTESVTIEASCCIWCVRDSGRNKLVLFVVPSAKEMFQELKLMKQNFVADLMSHLFKVLPSNSLPDLILPIEKLPLTKHAKVDKGKLISIVKDLLATNITNIFYADSGSNDEPVFHLKNLWMQYLNLRREPSSDDKFLMSGGDSLLALRLISELEENLNCFIPPLLLTKLLKGTYGEACACIQSESGSKEYDNNKEINSVALGKRTQVKLVESCSKVSKIERINENDLLCMECRRGAITKYNSTAKLAPALLANANSVTFKHKWKYDLGKCVDASPVLLQYDKSESIVVVGSHSHQLVAVNAVNGEKISSCELPDRIESSACSSICGKYIFVGCYNYSLYCINIQSGTIVWSFRTGNMIKSSPVIVNDGSAIIFGSYDEFLYCVKTQEGELIWKAKPGQGSIYSSPCLSQKKCLSLSHFREDETGNSSNLATTCPRVVLIGTLGGSCSAVSEVDGKILWSHEIQAPVFTSPLNFDGKALFSSVKGKLICFLVNSGEKVWSYQVRGNVFSSFSFLETRENQKLIVFGCHDHCLYCLNSDGELKWCTQLDSPIFTIPFIFPVQFVYITKSKQVENDERTDWVTATSTKGSIYLIDVYTGNINANMKIGNEIFSSPVVFQNSVIFGCRDNFLYSLTIS